MLLLLAHAVDAYGEGNVQIRRRPLFTASSSLQWHESSLIQNCAVLYKGTVHAKVKLLLPVSAPELKLPELCVLYTVRSDKAQNWWFVAPPPAEAQRRSCAPAVTKVRSKDNSVSAHMLISLDDLELPLGYSRINVVLEQPRNSTTPLVPPLDAVVAIVPERDSTPPAWLPSASRVPQLDKTAIRTLGESYRVVREDERAEKEEYARRTESGRAHYAPLHAWDQVSQQSTSALRGVLQPELLAALERPTPAALWRLVHTPDAHHPVHQIQLFSEQGADMLAEELAHAHATNVQRSPTNNVSDGLRESDDADQTQQQQTIVRDGPPSLLLDEVRLQAVAHALASAVLAPLSRLLYPEWTAGGQLDSYHAFSIHRRSRAANQDSWFRPSSNSEGGSRQRTARSADSPMNATSASIQQQRTGVHSDVCEVSLNVARVLPTTSSALALGSNLGCVVRYLEVLKSCGSGIRWVQPSLTCASNVMASNHL